MTITASQLRQDVYRLLDKTVDTGKPIKVRRKGHVLWIVSEPAPGGKLNSLVPHSCINGDPEDIVDIDWSDSWNSDGGLL